jgi:hypothetical protein
MLARKAMIKGLMAQEEEEKAPLTVREMAAMGGNARAKTLSKKRRKAIAKAGAEARWGKKKAVSSTSSKQRTGDS